MILSILLRAHSCRKVAFENLCAFLREIANMRLSFAGRLLFKNRYISSIFIVSAKVRILIILAAVARISAIIIKRKKNSGVWLHPARVYMTCNG